MNPEKVSPLLSLLLNEKGRWEEYLVFYFCKLKNREI
jgi:hypothetical protein